MPSTFDDPVFAPERCDARDQHHEKTNAPKPSSHKRCNSRDVVQAGAQFGHFSQGSKQNSWPLRPPQIDIPLEDIAHQHSAGDLAIEAPPTSSRLRHVIGRSWGGSRSTTSLFLRSADYHCSKEDVAFIIAQRDGGQGKATRRSPSSEASDESAREDSPSMHEDYDESDSHTPRPVTRAFTEISQPHTPPARSVTADEGGRSTRESTVGASPWSSNKRKRKFVDPSTDEAE